MTDAEMRRILGLAAELSDLVAGMGSSPSPAMLSRLHRVETALRAELEANR